MLRRPIEYQRMCSLELPTGKALGFLAVIVNEVCVSRYGSGCAVSVSQNVFSSQRSVGVRRRQASRWALQVTGASSGMVVGLT